MKIQGHLQDYPLSALLEVLADRRESGRLRIAFEPEPAILHFKRGQLVDARISLLQGSAAINLALSMDKAPFDFDNEIAPPQGAIDSHERAIMSRLLGMRLSAGDEGEPEPCLTSTDLTDLKQSTPEVPSIEGPTSSEGPTGPSFELPSSRIEGKLSFTRRSLGHKLAYLANLRPVVRNLPRGKLLRVAAIILIVAVPAAVGIKVQLGRRQITRPANAAIGQQKESPVQNSVDLPQTPVGNSPSAAVAEPTLNPTETQIPKEDLRNQVTPATESTKTVAEPEPSKVISKVTNVKEQPGSTSDSANAFSSMPVSRPGKTTKSIVIEIKIEQGRVTEASVKNSSRGQEAIEAAALRIIRQRRYSKELTGTESVTVNIDQ